MGLRDITPKRRVLGVRINMRKDVSPFATCCDWTWAIEPRPPSPTRRAPSRIGLEETVAAFTEAFKERTRERVPLDADQVAQALARKFGWRIQPSRAQHHRPVHAGPGSDPQLRVGARARAAQLAREARGPCRVICQSAADSRHAREAAAASARRTAGTSQRASLRHRPAAPGASTRTPQHPQARAPTGLRRGLQGRAYALVDALLLALRRFWGLVSRPAALMPGNWAQSSSTHPMMPFHFHILPGLQEGSPATAC